MHFFHQRTKEAEVMMGGGSERRAIGRRMHVRDVRTDRQVNRDRNAKLVGAIKNAGLRIFAVQCPCRQKFSRAFAITNARKSRCRSDLVEEVAGFGSHAEFTFAKAG